MPGYNSLGCERIVREDGNSLRKNKEGGWTFYYY
jgi:hypothetical protein